MTMSILNNTATMTALGELNKNINKLGKVIKQANSGMKLNSTGDGASEYAISEKMRVNIRSLNQDDQNVQNGRALLNVAEGGMQSIVDELRRLKELAIDSANGHHSDFDRAILQREFEERKAVIDEVVATTNYNGKILLDGRYGYDKTDVSIPSKDETDATDEKKVFSELDYDKNIKDIINNHENFGNELVNKKDLEITGCSSKVRPSGLAVDVAGIANIQILTSGIFDIPAGYSGNITVKADNVEIRGNGKTFDNIKINVVNPNSALWLNNVNIKNDSDDSIINFNGNNNELILLSNNSILSKNSKEYTKPVIDVGDGLTINNGSSIQEGTLKIINRNEDNVGYKSGIGSRDNESATLNINSGTLLIGTAFGAAIGSCASVGKMGDININGGHIIANTIGNAAVIGSGASGNEKFKNTSVGNISINNDAIVDVVSYNGAGIGAGGYDIDTISKTIAGNIIIKSPYVRSLSYRGDAIGNGVIESSSSGIKNFDEFGYAIMNYETLLPYPKTIDVVGNYDIPYTIDKINSYHLYEGKKKEGSSSSSEDSSNSKPSGIHHYDSNADLDGKLIIHTGIKSSQNFRIFINDMGTSALGIDKTTIDPSEKAIKAFEQLEDALEYTLNEITNIGAYNNRLEEIFQILIINNENITSAESVIRDKDMALTMTEYAKYNILSQCERNILSQSNQNLNSILSLLK